MCLYPRLYPNAKYKANKKNGGIIPPIIDRRVTSVPVGCGNCIECRKQKARAWQVRMLEDIKTNPQGKFITLTFSNESIKKLNAEIPNTYIDRRGKEHPLEGYKRDNEIATLAIKLFRERWRKKYGKTIRHWLITELGHKGTENIHLHGIIWPGQNLKDVKNIWQYGFVWDGYKKNGTLNNYVNERTVNYIMKYVSKIDLHHQYYKSKILSSPGIGKNYTEGRGDWIKNKYNGTETKETYRTPSGHQIAMPIYWRNKIYTEEQREALWLIKLDKKERWVCGERVDISNGIEEYYKILHWHQKRNTQLGYGSDQKQWNRAAYENSRRIQLLEQRTGQKQAKATTAQNG